MPTSALTRRTLLRGAALGTLALASGIDEAFGQASRPPNVVFIMADDWLRRCVVLRQADLRTPNIDSIAAKGVRFLQAYANSAVCSATRTALITGRYQCPARLGLEEPLGTRNADVGLPPGTNSAITAEKIGYGTTLIGKWHLGSLPKFGPRRAATTTSMASAAAPWTTTRTQARI